MNRASLQQLAEIRLSDARLLLSSHTNDAGARYMAGYAVECALKACIAKIQGVCPYPDFSDKEFRKENYFTHNVVALLKTARLEQRLEEAKRNNPALEANWALVANWHEGLRYETIVSRSQAEDLIAAIDDPQDGVMTWLKAHW